MRHIFAGHIHRTISGSVHGIPFSVFKSPDHQPPMTFDSADTSLSVAEPGTCGMCIDGSIRACACRRLHDFTTDRVSLNAP